VRNGWVEAGRAVRDARERQWPTQKGFALAIGLPVRTLGDVENGRRDSFGTATLGPIEDALGWPRGSIRRFATEGIPIRPLPDPEFERLRAAWHRLSDDAKVVLARNAEDAAKR
jgi:hypothetical protein